MAQENFARERHIFINPTNICIFRLIFFSLFDSFCNLVENVLDRILLNGPVAVDILLSWLKFHLHIYDSGSILSPVMLFFHQQIQLVQAILPGTIFFLVIFKRFTQPYQCNSTLVLNQFAHCSSLCSTLSVNNSGNFTISFTIKAFGYFDAMWALAFKASLLFLKSPTRTLKLGV